MSKYNSSSTKRIRCSNFTAFEVTTLVSLGVKHSKVLECKKSDHNIWEAKTNVWKQIQEKFTAATANNREVRYSIGLLYFGVNANLNIMLCILH